MHEKRYTIEELAAYSHFSYGMIYDLTHFGVLSSPARGLDPGQPGSKGSYPACVLKQLDRYKELKRQGLKKADIIAIMKQEVDNVSVLQG